MNAHRKEADSHPVEVSGMIARYGRVTVLDGVDFVAPEGQISVVLGKSGCGKTTLLRHILGLSQPTAGTVKLLGSDIHDIDEAQLKALRSDTGVLFQNGALFTSMTVGENVAAAIRENTDLPDEIIAQMVRMKLSLVGLESALHKYPSELSGGMRKRAALARAISSDPTVLFCDEPSAGLDPVTAVELDQLLLNLKSLFDMTLVVVTHELSSIRTIADRVVMLDQGKVIAAGSLDEVMQIESPVVHDFFHRNSRDHDQTRESLFTQIESTIR